MEFPVLDLEKWDELVQLEQDGNPGLIEQLTSVFLTEVRESIQRMREALPGQEPEAIWHEAHKVKSSSGSLGAAHLAFLFGQIESAGKAGPLADIPPLIEAAEAAFRSFQEALPKAPR